MIRIQKAKQLLAELHELLARTAGFSLRRCDLLRLHDDILKLGGIRAGEGEGGGLGRMGK